MTGTTIDNINELIQIIQGFTDQQNVLRYNSVIENDINQNGGTVVYSYNNIIMATEISDELYSVLQKNPYVDYIQELPLKKYGETDINLIDQLNVDTLSYYNNNINGTSGIEDGSIILGTSGTSGIDGLSGNTKKSLENNLENNISVGFLSGTTIPTITNTNLTILTSTNEWFVYELFVNGTAPITFEIIAPPNYIGTLSLQNSTIISGETNLEGIFNIIVKATNNYGIDTKFLVLTVSNAIKITNTNLQVYSKIGTQFLYTIESTGTPPKTYDVIGLPFGFSLNNNIISGIFNYTDTYNMTIIVSGLTNADSKNLTVSSGYPPIFTSPGQEVHEQYSGFSYQLVTDPSIGVVYRLVGILPPGLQFNGDIISGIPTQDGTWELTMKATNPFGEGSRDLIITIYQP